MLRLTAALCLLALPALGQSMTPEVMDCDWRASAWNIAEPWEDNARTFSGGKTRVAFLDTVEPALGWAHLLVLSPPYDELGSRQCKVIGAFSGLDFASLSASYDPATGLDFTVPVQVPTPDGQFRNATLWFRLNQATGDIWTDLR